MIELESYLHKNFSISTIAAKKLAAVISITEIKKSSLFAKKDLNNDKEYLVLEGICRSFINDTNGQEITLSFFTKNSPVSPNLIRCVAGKSILNLQALTDAKLAIFSSNDLMKLMIENREIELWANSVLQRELLQKVNKEISQTSKLAKDRLNEFRAQYPSLENLIPHPYIASYLGITNVSLSRLRKNASKHQ